VQLSARQINLVNELLIWVIYGEEYFGIDQLEAALVSLEPPPPNPLTSIRRRDPNRLGKEAGLY
jgi:hypothetical protein